MPVGYVFCGDRGKPGVLVVVLVNSGALETCGGLFGTHQHEGNDINLRLVDDEGLSGGLVHIDREFSELIDLDDPLHLCQQTCE